MIIKTKLKFFSLLLLSLSFVVLFSSGAHATCYSKSDASSQPFYTECLKGVVDGTALFCSVGSDPQATCCTNKHQDKCNDKPVVVDPNVGSWQKPCAVGTNACDEGLRCYPVSGKYLCCKTGDTSCLKNPSIKYKFSLCNPIINATEKTNCEACETTRGMWTALGCIHTDPSLFISEFLKIALGIAGGIALLLMVYGSFLISASAGDPKKAQEGREMITGTIAGLLFIIFSVVLLKFIGFDILQIPGL